MACDLRDCVFMFMTMMRGLPGTNLAHLVMERGGSPCCSGYGLRGSNRAQSVDIG